MESLWAPMAFAAITSAMSSATPAVAAAVDVLVSRAAGKEVFVNWQLTNGPEWCVSGAQACCMAIQSKKAVWRVCGVDHWRVCVVCASWCACRMRVVCHNHMCVVCSLVGLGITHWLGALHSCMGLCMHTGTTQRGAYCTAAD
jgi:hypothetical protein